MPVPTIDQFISNPIAGTIQVYDSVMFGLFVPAMYLLLLTLIYVKHESPLTVFVVNVIAGPFIAFMLPGPLSTMMLVLTALVAAIALVKMFRP